MTDAENQRLGRGNDADRAEGVAARIREAIATAAARLEAAGIPTEALAEFVPSRRVLRVFMRAAAMQPRGRVWRLGVFLLGDDGSLYATGSATRAVPPKYPGYQSISAEERRGYRAAAFAGPFAEGETVNFDTRPIEITEAALSASAGPLVLVNGRASVLWNASVAPENALGFDAYLAERLGLLLHSPTPDGETGEGSIRYSIGWTDDRNTRGDRPGRRIRPPHPL